MEGNYSTSTSNLEIDSGLKLKKWKPAFLILEGNYKKISDEQNYTKKKTGYRIIKRLFDIVISVIAMIVLSPLFLIIAIAIKSEDGGPVIHKRHCTGRNWKKFSMYKFRSMVINADDLINQFPKEMQEQYLQGIKLTNDFRITKVGKFIRKTSIDELPQLFNVLKGEMSIIGPRPVIDREVRVYEEQANKLLSVRPGITGTWQVYGRGEIAYLDVQSRDLQLSYVENMGLIYDLRILLNTIRKVLIGEGAR